jgi:hypothetical protein
MLQAAKNAVTAVRSQAAAAGVRIAAITDRAGDALRAAALGLVVAPTPVLVPVRVRTRRPGQTG